MNGIKVKHLLWLVIIFPLAVSCRGKQEPTRAPFFSASDNPIVAQADSFTKNKCPFTIPTDMPADMTANIDCATLTVPEDWQNREGPKIDLAVAIVKASGEDPKPDPVLVLIGHPAYGVDISYAMRFLFPTISTERDFILMDPRGTGYSQPAFSCPEYSAFSFGAIADQTQQEITDQFVDTAQRCADRLLTSGSDLSTYNTTAMAADLEALRQALGISQWNIFTLLNGSRLAQAMMRDYPQAIRSVVMDSPVPLEANPSVGSADNAAKALERFFARCAEDDKCNQAYPRLENTFYNLLDQIDNQPVQVSVSNLDSGKRYKVNLDSENLIAFMLAVLDAGDNSQSLGELPRMIFQLRDEKTEVASRLMGQNYQTNLPVAALSLWLDCKEVVDSTTSNPSKTTDQAVDPHLQKYFNLVADRYTKACEAFQSAKVNTLENTPVTSSVPTLLLTGEFSRSGSASLSEQAAKYLRHSTVVEFSSTGQFVYLSGQWSGCSHTIVDDFIAAPSSQLDVSCSDHVNKITWITLP